MCMFIRVCVRVKCFISQSSKYLTHPINNTCSACFVRLGSWTHVHRNRKGADYHPRELQVLRLQLDFKTRIFHKFAASLGRIRLGDYCEDEFTIAIKRSITYVHTITNPISKIRCDLRTQLDNCFCPGQTKKILTLPREYHKINSAVHLTTAKRAVSKYLQLYLILD